MKQRIISCIGILSAGVVLSTAVPTLADDVCKACPKGDHWVDICPAGEDTLVSTGALVGIDLDKDPQCEADVYVLLAGSMIVTRGGPLDVSPRSKITSPDGHIDVIETEIVSMVLAGGGVTLTGGAGMGAGGILGPSFGAIEEQTEAAAMGHSWFDVMFEIDLGGGIYYYNSEPLRMEAKINCAPPYAEFTTPVVDLCLGLFDDPVGGVDPIANLVFTTHVTFDPCRAECKDGSTGLGQTSDKLSCHGFCDSFCGTNDDVFSCFWNEQNVKGNCDVTCKDGSTDHRQATDPTACHAECDLFCGTNDDVFSCLFKGQNIKGNCDVFCKTGETAHITLVYPTREACHAECEASCPGGNENVLACFFKGENLKGGVCDAVCKDGTSDQGLAQDAAACNLLCDEHCITVKGSEVFSCFFKGQNIKGNCEVECKDDPVIQHLGAVPEAALCNALCDDHCLGKASEVFSCFFKGENVKGQCVAVCKDHTTQHTAEASAPDCNSACNTFCVTPENLQYCEFKDVAVKGVPPCVIECKDGTSDQTPAADAAACQTECDGFCGNENVKYCKYKGEFVDPGNIPTVTGWGMVVMALLVIAAGAVVIQRRRAMMT